MHKIFGLALVLAFVMGPAPSSALHREDIPVLVRLAHELEQRAAHVHQAAAGQVHHLSRREDRLIRSLAHFHGQAAQLHRTVESYFASPGPVLAALEHLNDDADRVEDRIYRAHALSHVVDDWNRCALLLRQINRYFGGVAHGDAGHHD